MACPKFPNRPFRSPVLPALLVLIVLLAAYSAPKASPTLPPFAPTLHVRIGSDSNACGITIPAALPAPAATAAAGSKRKAKWPLIVWLHGGMRSRNPEKGFESHRAMTLFVGPSDYYLCSPSAYLDREWTRPEGVAHVDALIDYMVARYPIDPKDITLVGVSDGCLGVIAYCVHSKREIRRRVLISSAPQLVLPLERLSLQAGFAQGSWDFFQGGRDRLFPSDQVLPYLRQWERTYPNAHLHFYPEGEHDFAYYAEHAADALRTVFLTAKPAAKALGAGTGTRIQKTGKPQNPPGKN